ncbi:MAG TPA: cytochrome c oxidase subunit 2A [Candidatus Bathyarchaeia archaeon]|nr:cytochrome c oxidase subunit 2A [Candidatus Bathyarchaeia archaeon]
MRPDTTPTKKNQEKQVKTDTEPLKGTFTSVLVLGAFIVVCWVAVFALFLNRA